MLALQKTKTNKSGGNGFESLNLSPPIFAGIKKLGYRNPTPVQRKSLPILLTGVDAVVMARTGSGKTVAFLVPVLERLLAARSNGTDPSKSAFAVILSPTRELSLQTLKVLRTLGQCCSNNGQNYKFIGINGGESMEKQFALLSSHPDVVVATPGRLSHHLSEIPDFHLRHCELVVFDEADRLFEMGFAMQLRQIVSSMPEHRQTMLFSATMPKALMEFTKTGMMQDPTVVRLDSEVQVSDELRIGFITCRSAEKDAVLLHLVRDVLPLMESGAGGDDDEEEEEVVEPDTSKKAKKRKRQKNVGKNSKRGLTLIFAATRHHVEYLTLLLKTSGMSATMIYGNMDNQARQHNLNEFQNGRCKILVVTDVAARGIDIPLIDHVIHYAFPPSAKLFVHRSGRSARAGRIGYCWGIVDPEELPYMVDLHVFLGRKLSTGYERSSIKLDSNNEEKGALTNEESKQEDNEIARNDDNNTYTIQEMTPDMVHYGCVPELVLVEEVENVRRMVDSEMAGSNDAEMLRNLTRVCSNAMKQYRRSRPEASKEGVRRAKALLEGDKETTGRRQLDTRGGIPSHPLLRGIELEKLKRSIGCDSANEDENAASKMREQREEMASKKLSDLKKRQEFLVAMSNFRPKETVFEAFATGGGRDLVWNSQVDKTTNGSAAALVAMKSMRRQMKMARDKGNALVIAGSKSALTLNGDMGDEAADDIVMTMDENQNSSDASNDESGLHREHEAQNSNAPVYDPSSDGKRRLSKAERKKMKKNPGYKPDSTIGPQKAKTMRGTDFRDNLHFIENDFTPDSAAAARDRQIEAAMQPSASSNNKGSTSLAYRIEENMLDIVGDENIDLVKRHRMMRWDKSKRKYVQTTVGDELSGDSKSKKMRLESGQLVKSDKVKLGELYEKWQKKTNKSIGRVGIFDDVVGDTEDSGSRESGPKGPNVNKGKNQSKNNDDKRTAVSIRKEREKKENMRVKNMKKEDRQKLERRKHDERIAAESGRKKGYQGKKGMSGKWKGNVKKGGKR